MDAMCCWAEDYANWGKGHCCPIAYPTPPIGVPCCPPPPPYMHCVHLCHVHDTLGVTCLLLDPLSVHLAKVTPMRATAIPAWGRWWSLNVESHPF